jgi:uncharacterized membrane protein
MRDRDPQAVQPWLTPMFYVLGAIVAGLGLPWMEDAWRTDARFNVFELSVSSAQAYLSAAASGMMALTGIVFAMAFVMVQFSAIAYSPRIVLWFARDRILFHALGAFSATFIFALATLAWVDRGGNGMVPPFSLAVVGILIVVSMLLFAQLMQRLNDLRITNVLHLIGDQGRVVIEDMFRRLGDEPPAGAPEGALDLRPQLGPATQTLQYFGKPRTVAELDASSLVALARPAGATIVMAAAVGDTLVEGSVLLRVHGAQKPLSEDELRRAVRLARERTFEQDPKYPIRLLVDVAIKALSPAINDPTTAVQAIDQLEDLLGRLGASELDAGYVADEDGALRLVFPTPTWGDYLTLAFDEIRQFGGSSIQVMRRMRAALDGLVGWLPTEARRQAVRRYVKRLDRAIERSAFDAEDQIMALEEDRQGIGLSRPTGERN